MASAALFCALFAAAPAGAAAAGSIAGTVTTSGGTPAPLAGVKVFAYKVEGPTGGMLAGFAATDATGAYKIASLPAGDFKVEFNDESAGYFTQYYDEKESFTEAETVELAADEEATGIDGALLRGGSVSGTVTAAGSGDPIQFVGVCAYDEEGFQRACGETGPSGQYFVAPLGTGDYRLGFLPYDEESFTPEYYPDKPTLEEATPIHVELGEAVTGKDAVLSAPPQPPAPPPSPAPVLSSPPPPLEFVGVAPVAKPRLHCRKGFRKRKVKGKVRCVKIHKKRHHRHHAAR